MQLTMHTNELHGTKFHNQANPKKNVYYTFFVLASTNNQCDFLPEVRWCINNALFQKK
jgi:hypothetical protein